MTAGQQVKSMYSAHASPNHCGWVGTALIVPCHNQAYDHQLSMTDATGTDQAFDVAQTSP